MQVGRKISLILFVGLFPIILFGQTNFDTSSCYIENIYIGENVFTKIESKAYFKGGASSFQNFLLKNINHCKFIVDLPDSQPAYTDKARIKFIISKTGVMSNLQVTGTTNDNFQAEIEKVFKQSACFWDPGDVGGRLVNGWYQYEIFYFIELKGRELKVNVGFKWYD